jgi:hypothetical protein
MNVGLTKPRVNALARAPGSGGALYAATNGAGVFLFTVESTNELVPREPVALATRRGPPRQVGPR